jgi:hypothetical protein
MDDSVFTFGSFKGKTYRWVFDNRGEYVKWVLNIRSPRHTQLNDFLGYARGKIDRAPICKECKRYKTLIEFDFSGGRPCSEFFCLTCEAMAL